MAKFLRSEADVKTICVFTSLFTPVPFPSNPGSVKIERKNKKTSCFHAPVPAGLTTLLHTPATALRYCAIQYYINRFFYILPGKFSVYQ